MLTLEGDDTSSTSLIPIRDPSMCTMPLLSLSRGSCHRRCPTACVHTPSDSALFVLMGLFRQRACT